MAGKTCHFEIEQSLRKLVPLNSEKTELVETHITTVVNFVSSGEDNTTGILDTLKTLKTVPDLLKHHNIPQAVAVFLNIGHTILPIVRAITTSTKAVFWIAAKILGDDKSSDITKVVQESVEKILKDYKDRKLQEDSEGTINEFKTYLSLFKSALNSSTDTMKEHEIGLFAAKPVYIGVHLIGKLKHIISNSSESQNARGVENINNYIELYTTLAMMRYFVLLMLVMFLRATRNSDQSASCIQDLANDEREELKCFLKFLTVPKRSQALFFSYFDISKCSVTKIFMDFHGLELQRLDYLTSGVYTLSPEEWPGCFMAMSNIPLHWLVSRKNRVDGRCKFEFEAVSGGHNIFHLRSSFPIDQYVYMTVFLKFCRIWDGHPGVQGEWKVVRFEDEKYMLSPRKWPHLFMCMRNNPTGSICGEEGNPSAKGIWVINDFRSCASTPFRELDNL